MPALSLSFSRLFTFNNKMHSSSYLTSYEAKVQEARFSPFPHRQASVQNISYYLYGCKTGAETSRFSLKKKRTRPSFASPNTYLKLFIFSTTQYLSPHTTATVGFFDRESCDYFYYSEKSVEVDASSCK